MWVKLSLREHLLERPISEWHIGTFNHRRERNSSHVALLATFTGITQVQEQHLAQ